MNKTELIQKVAEKTELTKADVAKVLEASFEVIVEALEGDAKVSIAQFGTFSTAQRAARTGINPHTKEKIEIAAKRVLKFKPSKNVADALE